MAKATVAISQDFFNSFAALPKSKQNKVMEFLSKFRSNPEANGFNYEKIQNASDPNMRSVRIDDTYRAILIREEGTNVYLLLWVDHHNEAYDWAVRKRCVLNHSTGSIQVYETQEATPEPEVASAPVEKPLFASVSDELLKKLGVPEDMIAFVRTLTESSFDAAKDKLPRDAFEALDYVRVGIDPKEVIAELYGDWYSHIKQRIQPDLDRLSEEVKQLKGQREEAYNNACKNDVSREEQRVSLEKARDISQHIDRLSSLIDLPEEIAITDRERSLLYGRIMAFSGRAGTGKSQLLAVKTQSLLNNNRIVLLLVAGIYFTADPIQEQITKNLRLDFSFEELIDILETIGEKNNCIVPIFIDALNETWNNRLWKIGLPSIIDKLKSSPMVRIVVSYRPEYEKIILPDSLGSGKEGVVRMCNRGFEENSINAIREFLNHYNIPFTPLEYFGCEMSNPLFLTLYCKTYNGEEVSLPNLYERLIEKANANIYSTCEEELRGHGYTACDDLLRPLIVQIAKYLVQHDERSISKPELIRLSYWSEFGLAPAPFISCLVKENIMHNSTFENVEKLYFAYDQMNDYYCAKAIMDMCSTKEEVREYLSKKVLGIENNKLGFSWNIDLFVNTCALYAEKYGEECIDIIDELSEDDDREAVFSRYLRAFQWRNTKEFSEKAFIELLRKYPCSLDDLWAMLIGNSVKVSHPFNADFLHKFLLRYEMNRRDYLWTVYINRITWDESDRIVQLIQMYDRGDKLEVKNEKQVELLLTLFSWILTSSNRWLRDYTSKAMIEILKDHFDLCKPLLVKFKDVNDPYVVQRLYGIAFGACCKRKTGDLKDIAEYVFEAVFNHGFFYDSDGKLAAFDTDMTQKINCVVVRKDILDVFLKKTGLILVWLFDGEKEIHEGDYSISNWSDWEGVFTYISGKISGSIHRLQQHNSW